MRMKAHQDKNYLVKSRAYIENTLNVMLNHVSMQELVDYSQLGKDIIKKMSNLLLCKEPMVELILNDLKIVTQDLHNYQEEMRKRNQQKEKGLNSEDLQTLQNTDS